MRCQSVLYCFNQYTQQDPDPSQQLAQVVEEMISVPKNSLEGALHPITVKMKRLVFELPVKALNTQLETIIEK